MLKQYLKIKFYFYILNTEVNYELLVMPVCGLLMWWSSLFDFSLYRSIPGLIMKWGIGFSTSCLWLRPLWGMKSFTSPFCPASTGTSTPSCAGDSSMCGLWVAEKHTHALWLKLKDFYCWVFIHNRVDRNRKSSTESELDSCKKKN